MVGFGMNGLGPHGHQRPASIPLGPRDDVEMNVGYFLTCEGAVVKANGEI